MRAKWLLGTILVVMALAAAPAHAGQFTVHACAAGGQFWENYSWSVEGTLPNGIGADRVCRVAGHNIDLHVDAGARTPDGAQGNWVFRAAPGTTIADFRLDRRLVYDNTPPDGTHGYYAVYALGTTVFAGAGNYEAATVARLRAQGKWYTDPGTPVTLDRRVVTRADFPALAGYKGDASYLALQVGCYRRSSPCGTGPGGSISSELYGSEIVINDPAAPTELALEASGLLAGGARNGADPVTIVRAIDNTGIRRAELVDVTDPAAPKVVGAEDYDTATSGTSTEKGDGCSFRLTRPCPNLDGEKLTPTSLPAGRRQVVVRVLDAGGNATQSAVYALDVAVPSDRGAPNGTNAGEGGTLTASFSSKRSLTRRTASFSARSSVFGKMVNEAGAPIANADIRVLTRDTDRNEFVDRGTVRTGADGTFSYKASAYANRLIQFGWKAKVNDARFAANAYLTQRVTASATLSASRSTVGLRRRVTLRGSLRGRQLSGVDIVLQGRARGERSYRTFDETRTRKLGRFTASVAFQQRASLGKTFHIRAKILPTGRFPYERGLSKTVKVRVR